MPAWSRTARRATLVLALLVEYMLFFIDANGEFMGLPEGATSLVVYVATAVILLLGVWTLLWDRGNWRAVALGAIIVVIGMWGIAIYGSFVR